MGWRERDARSRGLDGTPQKYGDFGLKHQVGLALGEPTLAADPAMQTGSIHPALFPVRGNITKSEESCEDCFQWSKQLELHAKMTASPTLCFHAPPAQERGSKARRSKSGGFGVRYI